ncbi:GAF and ANTAR domain-containing protein [Kribbella sp. NPDC023855]|uniref:GAF and ANTAR domain-containing protein n=1 Tax=Kribbella sp. NPDC023855 TaxID=3154698 RepID=UPI0033ECC938
MTTPSSSVATAEVFAQLAQDLYQLSGVEQTAAAVLRAGSQVINCTHAGLLLKGRRDKLLAGPTTGKIVDTVNQLQIEQHRGPARDVLVGQHIVLVHDTSTEDRWPEWAGAAADLGLRSLVALPLATHDGVLGVLELFGTERAAFSPCDVETAHALCGHLAVALRNARQEETLREAMESHKLIGQAMGILMERYGIDADQAFAVLRRCSQDRNLLLGDIANQLIHTGRLPEGTRVPLHL